MSLIHNEQTKLTANYFNAAAIATLAAGSIAPLAAAFYGLAARAEAPSTAAVVFGSVICLIVSGILHFVARAILKGLQT